MGPGDHDRVRADRHTADAAVPVDDGRDAGQELPARLLQTVLHVVRQRRPGRRRCGSRRPVRSWPRRGQTGAAQHGVQQPRGRRGRLLPAPVRVRDGVGCGGVRGRGCGRLAVRPGRRRWRPKARARAALAVRGRRVRGAGRFHLPEAGAMDAAGRLVLLLHQPGHHRVRRAHARRHRVHQGRVRVRIVRLHTGRHGRGGHVLSAAAGRAGRHVAQLPVVLLLVVVVVVVFFVAAAPPAKGYSRVHRSRYGRRRRRRWRGRRCQSIASAATAVVVAPPRRPAAAPQSQQRHGRGLLTRGLRVAAPDPATVARGHGRGRQRRSGDRPETVGTTAVAPAAAEARSAAATARVRRPGRRSG